MIKELDRLEKLFLKHITTPQKELTDV